MEYLIDLLTSIVRPLGNLIAKKIFANKLIEENSILSDATGAMSLLLIIITFFFLLTA